LGRSRPNALFVSPTVLPRRGILTTIRKYDPQNGIVFDIIPEDLISVFIMIHLLTTNMIRMKIAADKRIILFIDISLND
jgi:hypothetical protein